MADIDDVLERLVTDATFRRELAADPGAALAAYELSKSDLELLANSLDSGDDAQRGVEQRTSKSAVVGLLASLSGGGGGGQHEEGMRKHVANIKWSGRQSSGKGLAPPGAADELAKLPGRPKGGEITLTRDMAPGSGGTTDAEELAKLPGKPKPGEITLTRSMSNGSDQAPEPTGGPSADGHFVKLTNANMQARLAPPGTSAPDEDALHVKLTNATVDDRLAPPSTSSPDEDALHVKLKGSDLNPSGRKIDISPMKAGDTSVDRLAADRPTAAPADFLTIEDA